MGPAGLAACVQALAAGYKNIVAIDPSPEVGSGGLTGFTIFSNSPGNDFTVRFEDTYPKVLKFDEARPLAGVKKPVNIAQDATPFLKRAAYAILSEDEVHFVPEKVSGIRYTDIGYIVTSETERFCAPRLFVAIGGQEFTLPELADRGDKVFSSRDLLNGSREAELRKMIANHPEVSVVGNSHGAISSADELLKLDPSVKVRIHVNSPTKPYFVSRQEANEFDYVMEKGRDTICPDTGQINRYDGVRGPARKFYLEVRNGQHADRICYDKSGSELELIHPDAPIVQATGYTARKLPIYNEDGSPMDFSERTTAGGFSRIYGPDNRPLPGGFGLGIGRSKHDGTNVYHDHAVQALQAGL